MMELSRETIRNIMNELGLVRFEASIDEYYNLLWDLNTSRELLSMRLNQYDINFISGLTSNEIITLLNSSGNIINQKARR